MSESRSAADRMREAGLFELQGTLAGLLASIAEFLQRHRIEAPQALTWRKDPSRGWVADIELTADDFLRVLDGYPMPVSLQVEDGQLRVATELRAATVRAALSPAAVHGQVEGQALVLRIGAAPSPVADGTPRARTQVLRG